jgi:heat shock transcription factor
MGQHLQVTEQRQQQIMAFLAKAVQTPGFLAHLVSQNEMATAARKKRRLQKDEDGGEVEDSSDPPTPTDGQIITIQTKGEVLSQILQLLSPSDASFPAIDNHHLESLLKDYNSALTGSEGNNLNQQSGVTLMDVSTGGTEQLQSEPVLTDPRSNEGIVELPSSPTSDVARVAGMESFKSFSTICLGTSLTMMCPVSACHCQLW